MSEIKALYNLYKLASDFRNDVYKRDEADYLLEIADGIQAEVGSLFMALPLDAKSTPIRVGEHVRGKYTDDKALYKVHGFMFDFEHGQWNIALNESRFASSNLLVRCEQRTLEDVLNDFGRKFAENYHYPNADGLVDKTADEIRELLKEGSDD